MRSSTALLIGVLLVAAASVAGTEPGIEVLDVTGRTADDRYDTNVVVYTLAVVAGAGWRRHRVERAVREVEAIYAQCDVTVTASSVLWLKTPGEFDVLEESMQPRLLAELPTHRPVALLVNLTADGDTAYSYLMSAPVASHGTAWITRKSHPGCLGALLGHELGHILMDTDRHSPDAGNLMSHTCTVSNVAGSRPGTTLAVRQATCLVTPPRFAVYTTSCQPLRNGTSPVAGGPNIREKK